VATQLARLHPQIDSVLLLHFKSPFSRECEELRSLAKVECAGATYRTQSVKKDYQDLIGLSETGEFSLRESCRHCQTVLLSKAARYMERTGAEYLVTGHVPKVGGLTAKDLSDVLGAQGLAGRVLSPLMTERPTRFPADVVAWADETRQRRTPISEEEDDRFVRRLANRLNLDPYDPAPSRYRCKLATPGYGERVALLFNEQGVTLNALRLLDFPLYMNVLPDHQIVLALDEDEKRDLQNYFLPQDFRIYPATPHGPMTLLRIGQSPKTDDEMSRVLRFVARVTATYALNGDVPRTVPVYYRRECEDDCKSIKVEPFSSIEELQERSDVALIPLHLPEVPSQSSVAA
jgi:hypothetical protein